MTNDLKTRRHINSNPTRNDQMINIDFMEGLLLCNYKTLGYEILDLSVSTSTVYVERCRPTFCHAHFGSSPNIVLGPSSDSKNVCLFDNRSKDHRLFLSGNHGYLMSCHFVDYNYIMGAYDDGTVITFDDRTSSVTSELKITSHEILTTSRVVGGYFLCAALEPNIYSLKVSEGKLEDINKYSLNSPQVVAIVSTQENEHVAASSDSKFYIIKDKNIVSLSSYTFGNPAIDISQRKINLSHISEQDSENYIILCGGDDGFLRVWTLK